jgi:hypothetical protein
MPQVDRDLPEPEKTVNYNLLLTLAAIHDYPLFIIVTAHDELLLLLVECSR